MGEGNGDMDKALKVEIQSDVSFRASADIERSIFDLNTQIDMLSSVMTY